MRVEKLTFKIASWSLIVVGIGHTITYVFSPKNAKQIEMIQQVIKLIETTAQRITI